MDRKADPCTDFFEFANGAWRAQNPIPASMPRWSRRWAAGESTKDRLKRDPRGDRAAGEGPARLRRAADRRLLRRLHGRGADRTAWARSRSTPLPRRDPRDRDARGRAADDRPLPRDGRSPSPFAVAGGSDNHNPNDVIAQIFAEGLGMPDRDYYVKPERASRRPAKKYLDHVAAIFALAAIPRRRREGGGGHGHADGDEARRSVARQRGAARPEGHRPQDDVRRAPEAHAALRLGGLLPDARVWRGRRQRRRAEVPARSSTAS